MSAQSEHQSTGSTPDDLSEDLYQLTKYLTREERATLQAWRNKLARTCADMRDERDTALALVDTLRIELAQKTAQFDSLCVAAEDGGISGERIDQLADDAYSAVDRLVFSERWFSITAYRGDDVA